MDTLGNSAREAAIFERLSRDMGMRLMEAGPTGSPPSAGPRSGATPRVYRFSDVGRRMVLEALRRLALDGRTTTLVDPDIVLPDPDLGDGRRPVVHTDLREVLARSSG